MNSALAEGFQSDHDTQLLFSSSRPVPCGQLPTTESSLNTPKSFHTSRGHFVCSAEWNWVKEHAMLFTQIGYKEGDEEDKTFQMRHHLKYQVSVSASAKELLMLILSINLLHK